MSIAGMVQFTIPWKFISSRSDGNNTRYGRWNGTDGGYVEKSRDADTGLNKKMNIHDTSKLPKKFYAMRFVRQNDEHDTESSATKTDQPDPQTNFTNTGQATKQLLPDDVSEPSGLDVRNVQESHHFEEKPKKLKLNIPDETRTVKEVATDDLPKQMTLSFANERQAEITLSKQSLHKLQTLVLSRREHQNPTSILHESANFSNLKIECLFQDDTVDLTIPRHTCSIHINEVVVAKCTSFDKKTAKNAASESALELLKQTQPTIYIGPNPGDLETAISRDEISRCKKNADEIADTNIGSQLLRKMGWKGQGGLGKLGTGISVPVDVKESRNRAGLGAEFEDSNFISFGDAHDVIRNYASSKSLEKLTFSPELTNPERSIIHRLSKRYGLKSRSYNKGDVRYLVVSRKLSAIESVRQLKLAGGVKGNVQLILPFGEINFPICLN